MQASQLDVGAVAEPDQNEAGEGAKETAAGSEGVEGYSYPQPPAIDLGKLQAHDCPRIIASLPGPSTGGEQRPATKRRRTSQAQDAGTSRNFWRKARWSPDGQVILAQSESHHISILSLQGPSDDGPPAGPSTPWFLLEQSLFKAPSPILDAVWYPIPAYDSESKDGEAHPQARWCYAQSCRDVPIKLVDSSDGTVKASYAIMDHVERFVAPHSLAFSLDQSRMYCGEWSQLSIYPLASPGHNRHSRLPLVTSRAASSSANGGQRGFVSALSVASCPEQYLLTQDDETASQGAEIVACGTLTGTVGLYVVQPSLLPPPMEHNITEFKRDSRFLSSASACLAGWTEQDSDGIHQLAFHPLASHLLFVSSRRSDHIHVYDTRYLIGATGRFHFRTLEREASPALIAKMHRPSSGSHQRLSFEIDWAGRFLAAGDQHGYISIWRIDTRTFIDGRGEGEDVDPEGESSTILLEPDLRWKAHDDAVGSLSFHPFKAHLLSVAGSRLWPTPDQDERSSSSSDEDRHKGTRKQSWYVADASLKIWDLA